MEEILRFGAEIEISDRWGFTFGPFRKRSRLERLLRIRTGFEGMELAITEAAAAARAEGPGMACAEDGAPPRSASRRHVAGAWIMCGAGLLSLAVAAAVQPQAGGWVVYSTALLLRVVYGAAGVTVLLIGAWSLRRAWCGRRTAPQSRG